MADVTGATVTVDKYAMALLRGEYEGWAFLVGRRKLVEPNFSSGYSSGHAASASQPRVSASACDFRE
jgi:hypothetical protein